MGSAGNTARSPSTLSWANRVGCRVWQCNLAGYFGFVESVSTACIKVRVLIMQKNQENRVSMGASDNSGGSEGSRKRRGNASLLVSSLLTSRYDVRWRKWQQQKEYCEAVMLSQRHPTSISSVEAWKLQDKPRPDTLHHIFVPIGSREVE